MNDSFSSINQSCLNNSSSKQLFSFSKQRRFKTQLIPKNNSTDQFYSIPSIFNPAKLNGPLFGKDRKKLIFPGEIQSQCKPGPQYHIQVNSITQSVRLKKGITIAMKRTDSNRSLIESQKFPSPLSYQKITQKSLSLKKHSPTYSFSKQIKELRYPQKDRLGQDSPGCKYLIQLSKLEKIYTKLKSTKNTKIVKLKEIYRNKDLINRKVSSISRRNTQDMTKSIERRQMQLVSHNNPQKAYINNRFKTSPRVVFSNSIRQNLNKKLGQSPGPGQYGKFSEFARVQKLALLKKTPNSLPICTLKRNIDSSSVMRTHKRNLSMRNPNQKKSSSSLPRQLKKFK